MFCLPIPITPIPTDHCFHTNPNYRGFRNRVSQPPPGRPGRHPGHPRGGISRGHFPDVHRRQGHRFNVRKRLAGVVGDLQRPRSLSRTRSRPLQRGILRGHFRKKQKRRGAKGAGSPCGRRGLSLAVPERCSSADRPRCSRGCSAPTAGEPFGFPGKFIRRGVGVGQGERALERRAGFKAGWGLTAQS